MNILLKVALALIFIVPVTPAVTSEETDINYKSVREALDDLRKQPGASLTAQGAWSVVTNTLDTGKLLWSFTQPSHYAHPSVARREVIEEDGVPYIQTSLLCEASLEACDQLVIDFQRLDQGLGKRQAMADSATTE